MHVHNGEVDIYPSFVQVLCASSSRLMACDKEEVNMAVRMAELHCVKHGIWCSSIFLRRSRLSVHNTRRE